MPVAELAADVPAVQNVAQDPVHVPWLPPRLEASATVISATVVTSHSSSTACGKPSAAAEAHATGVRRQVILARARRTGSPR